MNSLLEQAISLLKEVSEYLTPKQLEILNKLQNSLDYENSKGFDNFNFE